MSDSGSGHDLAVREFEPRIRLSAVSAEPTLDLLSAPSMPCTLSFSLSLKNKHLINFLKKYIIYK